MATIRRPAISRPEDPSDQLRWQKHTTDNIAAVNAPQLSRCSVYRAAAYSAVNTQDYLPFDSIDFASGELSLVSGVGIRCAQAGYVQASFSVRYAASAAGSYRRSFLLLSRTALTRIWGRASHGASAAYTVSQSGSALIAVAAGDIIRVGLQQDTGGALALQTPEDHGLQLTAFYVSFI